MRELRIHHFFDIIRDYGGGKVLTEHEYGHSYHIIGNEIFNNKIKEIKLVVKNDDICENCSKLVSNKCIDEIQHRADFKSKEKFNDYLDNRIMNCMGYKNNQIIEINDIIKNADKYIDSIFDLYEGNDVKHTEVRKCNVSAGIDKKLCESVLSENQ